MASRKHAAADQRSLDIAERIRQELVCCDIYNEIVEGNDSETIENLTQERAEQIARHALCYWGEASARIAEGSCPGYETVPNICRCACEGCRSNCAAHVETETGGTP